MQKIRNLPNNAEVPITNLREVEDLPIKVAVDWNLVVSNAEKTAAIIDSHLDFESRLQRRDLKPLGLCPEQRVSLITDLTNVGTHG